MINQLCHTLINVILPHHCLVCNAISQLDKDICQDCWLTLPRSLSSCTQCGKPLDIAHTKPLHCGECLKRPPDYDTTVAPLIYQDAVISLITRLKFYHNFAAARLFAELIADRAMARYPLNERPSVLIPVPLHAKRLRLRGYNQATLLANHLAKLTKIPVNRLFCRRIHHTLPQSKTSAALRHSNLLGAFAIDKASEAEHVALIDDVMTTGATVGMLSQVLKAQGVKRVSVWCIARA